MWLLLVLHASFQTLKLDQHIILFDLVKATFLNLTSGLDLYQFHYVTLHSCVYKTPIAIGRLLQILYSPRSTATGEKIIALLA